MYIIVYIYIICVKHIPVVYNRKDEIEMPHFWGKYRGRAPCKKITRVRTRDKEIQNPMLETRLSSHWTDDHKIG